MAAVFISATVVKLVEVHESVDGEDATQVAVLRSTWMFLHNFWNK